MMPDNDEGRPGKGGPVADPLTGKITADATALGVSVPWASVCVVACASWASCPHACHVGSVTA